MRRSRLLEDPPGDGEPNASDLSWPSPQVGSLGLERPRLAAREDVTTNRPLRRPGAPTAGRLYTEVVFDEVIMGGSPVETSSSFDKLLGSEDAFSLAVTTTQVVGGTPAMTVDVLHSGDRLNWGVAQANVVAFWISTVDPTTFWGPVSTPTLLGFVRLRITLLGSGDLSARVKVRACGRKK
jgi:hypothetical protein